MRALREGTLLTAYDAVIMDICEVVLVPADQDGALTSEISHFSPQRWDVAKLVWERLDPATGRFTGWTATSVRIGNVATSTAAQVGPAEAHLPGQRLAGLLGIGPACREQCQGDSDRSSNRHAGHPLTSLNGFTKRHAQNAVKQFAVDVLQRNASPSNAPELRQAAMWAKNASAPPGWPRLYRSRSRRPAPSLL